MFKRPTAVMKLHFQILTLLWCFVDISKAAKIVVVPPIMFESHLYIFKTLAKALHEHGHETAFAVSEGREIPSSDYFRLLRYPGFFNSTTADEFLQSKMMNIFSGRLTALELFDILEHYSKNCDIMVGSRGFIAQLKKEKFDLLLVDPNEMCGFVIAHLLGVKYAVFSTGLWYPTEVGAPTPLAYVPEFNSLLTDNMNLFQRITNIAVYLVSRFGVNFLFLPKYERIMLKYKIEPERSMYDLIQGSSLWMLCTDVALEFPRPTLPNVVYVGGILTKPASVLPEDFMIWADGAKERGFVLVSFGAGVKYLSDDVAHKLAGALARLPQKVMWRNIQRTEDKMKTGLMTSIVIIAGLLQLRVLQASVPYRAPNMTTQHDTPGPDTTPHIETNTETPTWCENIVNIHSIGPSGDSDNLQCHQDTWTPQMAKKSLPLSDIYTPSPLRNSPNPTNNVTTDKNKYCAPL
ncbi:2-hydroxyacylsphingosine 1-beta-galactosyltransferase isoform X4 [Scyliorhinus torazame]|uniref:2-hydroxyacylsphingosine 1-beta-galactosyltransferase isoform X4 n=1 Tax=Scyliorhinus torazame TaxID=75743 RepID=UPI003B5C0317